MGKAGEAGVSRLRQGPCVLSVFCRGVQDVADPTAGRGYASIAAARQVWQTLLRKEAGGS